MHRRTSWTKIVPGALLTAALLLPGAAPARANGGDSAKIRAAGTLNVEGRCRILTDDAGHQYALMGNLGSFTTGDRISVTGTRGEPSACIEGTTIRVESARPDVPRRAGLTPGRVAYRAAGSQATLPVAAPVDFRPAVFRLDAQPDAGDRSRGNDKGGKAGKGEISLRGTLTGEGVECQALRGSDGRLYTLTGNLKGYSVGDRVHVVGTRAEASTCQQGVTIGVQHIEHENVQGDEPTAQLKREIVHLVGALTGDGVACQAFRAENGETYTLTGDLKGFKAGDRVELAGTVVEGSTCQEPGTTLQVKVIRRAK